MLRVVPLYDSRHRAVEEILSRLSLVRSRVEISGLTISGGEPLEQAPGLVQLVENVRGQFPDLSIGLFSGYSETELDRGRYFCLHRRLWLRSASFGGEFVKRSTSLSSGATTD